MSKPRIGITANIEIMEAGAHPGMYRAFINYDYVEAVEDAGGVCLCCFRWFLIWKM